MQLLLFFSAILTALTGAVSGRASVPQQLACAVASIEAGAVAKTAERPAARSHIPAIAAILPEPPMRRALALLPTIALYAGRLRV